MTRVFCVAALVTFSWGQKPTFKGGISIVEVDAHVSDDGGPIEGLLADDFSVLENGHPVRLRYCSLEETSLDVILLFEVSRFMAPKSEQLRVSAEMALAELRDGDRVGVMSFSKTTQLELGLTTDLKATKPRIRSGLADARFSKEPSILVAADAAAQYLGTFPASESRRVVLIFTGDVGVGFRGDNGFGKPREEIDSGKVARHFCDNNIALGGMIIPTVTARFLRVDPLDARVLSRIVNYDDFVEPVVTQTGGQIVFAGDIGSTKRTANPNGALREVIRRMRSRYKLYFEPDSRTAGARRTLDVSLTAIAFAQHPKAKVLARRAYLVSKSRNQ
jgi:hypothetical protein